MSTAPPAIRVRGLGKYFGAPMQMDGVEHSMEALRGLLRIAGISLRAESEDPQVTVAAPGHVLQDVSLDIHAGSVVCLTGPSGSGKSVLLKILAGVMPPTSGRVEIYGSVASLLEVGDNLDTQMTARENIAALTGQLTARPEEAGAFEREVIAFAGLGGFEDAPIRTYSTGMVLRLSAALALCGRHSIVFIDDVLAVGDIGFQQKCVDRVHELKEAGCTLVVAFSDEDLVHQLATRVITLGSGHIVHDMSPDHWSARRTSGGADLEWQVLRDLPEDEVMALREVRIADCREAGAVRLKLAAHFEAKAADLRCRPVVSVSNNDTALFRSVYPEYVAVPTPRALTFTVHVPIDMLPAGEYRIGFSMASLRGQNIYAMKANDAVKVTIRRHEADTSAERAAPGRRATPPLLLLDAPWEVERLAEAAAL